MAFQGGLERKGFGALMVFAMGVLVIGVFRGKTSIRTYLSLRESRKVLSNTVKGLEQDIAQLEAEKTKIQSSPAYVHKILRDKYHLTEAGEQMLFFED